MYIFLLFGQKSCDYTTTDFFAYQRTIEGKSKTKVDRNNRKLRAGVASVAAMANIPQAVTAGKNAVGVGVGSHNGQNAIAVGYSRVSDSNKTIFKASAAVSTQGGYTVGAGVSYQW